MNDKIDLVSDFKGSLLDVGSGPEGTAKTFFPEATIFRLDADPSFNPDYVHDIREPFPDDLHEKFDIVFCSHIMEHIERALIESTLLNLKSVIKQQGELWIIVPSMEWVALQLTRDQPSPIWQAVIYGSQENEWQYHKSGYTLYFLRKMIERVQMIPRQAYQGPFQVEINGQRYDAIQNYMVAQRYDEAFTQVGAPASDELKVAVPE